MLTGEGNRVLRKATKFSHHPKQSQTAVVIFIQMCRECLMKTEKESHEPDPGNAGEGKSTAQHRLCKLHFWYLPEMEFFICSLVNRLLRLLR